MSAPRLALIGRSRAGLSVAAALRAAGLDWIGTWNRTPFAPLASEPSALDLDSLACDLAVIAVRDEAIETVARTLADSAGTVQAVVHLSGAGGLEPLESVALTGAEVGFVHPVRSFPEADVSGDALRGAYCGAVVPDTASFLRDALARAGARVLDVEPGAEVRYHAACTIAANLTVSLVDVAVALFAEAGIPPDTAALALGDLAGRSARGVAERGPRAALTGPVERGDADVVAAHARTLRSEELEIYRLLSLRAVALAGLDEEAARRVRDALDEGSGC